MANATPSTYLGEALFSFLRTLAVGFPVLYAFGVAKGLLVSGELERLPWLAANALGLCLWLVPFPGNLSFCVFNALRAIAALPLFRDSNSPRYLFRSRPLPFNILHLAYVFSPMLLCNTIYLSAVQKGTELARAGYCL